MKIKNGFFHLFLNALADFKRNKIRTLLTSLGIMIGVLSVVMLIALGLGLKNYLKEQFEKLGANLIMIFPGNVLGDGGGGSSLGAGLFGGTQFDEKDLVSLEKIPEAEYVVPVFFKSTAVEANGKRVLGYIMGSNEDMFKVMNLEPIKGSLFSEIDIKKRAKVIVLGGSLAEKLYDQPEDSIGQKIRLDNQRYKIIGVVDKTGDRETDNSLIIPYKTTYGSLNPNKTFFTIYLGVPSKDEVEYVQQRAKEILLKRYDEDDFSVTEQSEILSTVNQIFSIVNSILIAIGSISLLVGGIGIMNIMYASVTERTKEVGIRRAIGATQKDILLQFLTESVTLSLFGGLLGLLLSIIIVFIVRFFFPVAINLLAVSIALLVSSGIGIFFGVFPARRAAKLPPIEAIRYE